VHSMPLHHEAEQYVRAYMDRADLWDKKKTPLFRSSFGKTKKLTENRLHRKHVHAMIRRRARDVGILSPIGCHTWRATGITDFLVNGGSLESAQKMAAHSSPRTTKLYDRRDDAVTLDEVELVRLR
jgi:integrase/recombinase XerD